MFGSVPGQSTSSSIAESRETESADCAICLEAFTFDRPVTTTVCNHTFHETCLNISLNYGNRCPICRTTLVERVITLNPLINNQLILVPRMIIHQEMTTQGRIDAGRVLLPSEIAVRVPSFFFNMTTQEFANCVKALVEQHAM